MMADSTTTTTADPQPQAKQVMPKPITYTYRFPEPESESEDEAEIPKRYYSKGCKCCQKLEKTAPKPNPDDDYYLPREDAYADQGLNLRLIRYLRMERETGGFGIECPPILTGFTGGIYHRDHFKGWPDFDKMLNESLQFVIDTYNEKTGEHRELLQILNVSVSRFACMVFWITFECWEPPSAQEAYVKAYQTVVAYHLVDPDHPITVLVLRRKSDGQDLIPPEPYYGKVTRPGGQR